MTKVYPINLLYIHQIKQLSKVQLLTRCSLQIIC